MKSVGARQMQTAGRPVFGSRRMVSFELPSGCILGASSARKLVAPQSWEVLGRRAW